MRKGPGEVLTTSGGRFHSICLPCHPLIELPVLSQESARSSIWSLGVSPLNVHRFSACILELFCLWDFFYFVCFLLLLLNVILFSYVYYKIKILFFYRSSMKCASTKLNGIFAMHTSVCTRFQQHVYIATYI